jgi:hypothetical protein
MRSSHAVLVIPGHHMHAPLVGGSDLGPVDEGGCHGNEGTPCDDRAPALRGGRYAAKSGRRADGV